MSQRQGYIVNESVPMNYIYIYFNMQRFRLTPWNVDRTCGTSLFPPVIPLVALTRYQARLCDWFSAILAATSLAASSSDILSSWWASCPSSCQCRNETIICYMNFKVTRSAVGLQKVVSHALQFVESPSYIIGEPRAISSFLPMLYTDLISRKVIFIVVSTK